MNEFIYLSNHFWGRKAHTPAYYGSSETNLARNLNYVGKSILTMSHCIQPNSIEEKHIQVQLINVKDTAEIM